jgi:hypothetical protein
MESAQDRADYPRYLLRLCELERIDRERRNVERRMDTALVDFDFAKASAILADMVASYLAASAPPFNPEGPDDNEFEDRRSTPVTAGLHLHPSVDDGGKCASTRRARSANTIW